MGSDEKRKQVRVARWLGLGVGAAATLGIVGLQVARARGQRGVDRLWSKLEKPLLEAAPVVIPDEGLPAPARRYLEHALSVGDARASVAQINMRGTLRPKPDGDWVGFKAEQILRPPIGFVWKAHTISSLMKLAGGDHYHAGDASTDFWLWKSLPVIHASNTDTVRSAKGRLAMEALMMPASLLPGNGVRWSEVSEDTARYTMWIDGEDLSVDVTVDEVGKVRRAVMQRWGTATTDGRPGLVPFGMEVDEERKWDGYTIPSKIRAGWWFDTPKFKRYEFFRAEISEARYR